MIGPHLFGTGRWRSAIVTILFSLAALTILPGDCYRPPPTPHTAMGPTQVAERETASYSTFLDSYHTEDSVRYRFDWGAGSDDTTGYFRFDETVTVSHAWDSIGVYLVRVLATNDTGPSWGWSDPLSVTVYPSSLRVSRDTFAD